MARFCRDENGFYKYLIMSTLYHYAECHKVPGITKQNSSSRNSSIKIKDVDLLEKNNKRVRLYNRDVVAYLKDAVFNKKTATLLPSLTRLELNQLVTKMNRLAESCPAEGLATTERYEIRGRSKAMGIRIRCQ